MVGNFDGVHLGHRRVLERGLREARSLGLQPLVLTFDPHPAEVLGRGHRSVLTPLPRKVELLAALSTALTVVVEPFTHSLAALSPSLFAEQLLAIQMGAARVLTGVNFRFGHKRQGDATSLIELGKLHGFSAEAEPLGKSDQKVISSTRIRSLIEEGEVKKAAALLGRPHSLAGRVIRGDGQARQLGVPSANLEAPQELLPARGVYAVSVEEVQAQKVRHLGLGVANVGIRPTLGEGPLRVEAHLLDFNQDLYGRTIRLHLMQRLRGEQHFESLNALKSQLEQDKKKARDCLLAAPLPGKT